MQGREVRLTALAVAVGIVAAGTIAWLAEPSVGMPSCGTSRNTPLGSSFALSEPSEQIDHGEHWYNFSIQSGAGVPTFSTLTFAVTTREGTNITPGTNWSITALSASGEVLGQYTLSGLAAGTWPSGGPNTVRSGDVLSLMSGTTGLSGDVFVLALRITGPCGWGGSISVLIP